ncbi:MAG: three-Cys-motif partner protein TcmP [Oscillospiraceae bacterium]|nr:three-Cys-motif partner protein TcmP [Oscillospiraceae bacterium]
MLKDKVTIINEDCNIALKSICEDINWNKNRAILFLDPYTTEVEWNTLKIVAATIAIDVWYLFPFLRN